MTTILLAIGVLVTGAAFLTGYYTGYRTRKTEEETRAAARAARLREFTAKGRVEDGEWFKVKKRS